MSVGNSNMLMITVGVLPTLLITCFQPFLPIASVCEGSQQRRSLLNVTPAKMDHQATLDKLEAGFNRLQEDTSSKSLLKKYLTREVFDKLKVLKTPSYGSTLLDCIQSGIENLDYRIGIYASDPETYSVFADLFDPIIEDYHAEFGIKDKHPPVNFGDLRSIVNVDTEGQFVVTAKVSLSRSIQDYPFSPRLSETQYKDIEKKLNSILSILPGELKGTYYPVTGMTKEVQQQLIEDLLFGECDRFLEAANACRFWPSGRGIYHNDPKTFLSLVNAEDHLRIISMQMGGDLGQVYRRLVMAVSEIESHVAFSHHDRLGFLTLSPANLGTAMHASVHIRLPKLSAKKAKLEELAAKFDLQVRGIEGNVYDITNKRRLGVTEIQLVQQMQNAILQIISLEKSM